MNRKLLKSFIKDERSYSYVYFISNFFIWLFYYMTFEEEVEIIYPLSISLFIYFVFIFYKFYGYYSFNKGLEEIVKYHDYKGDFPLERDKKVNRLINKLHIDYLDRLSKSDSDRKKERRFLSLWIHNMKTPITVTDLLIQRVENEEISPLYGIGEMKEENKKLLTSLDTILNMIRLEEFAKDYIPEEIDLLGELNSIINRNKNLFIYNSVFPKVVTDLQEAKILSDKKWNKLMIEQIISNGVKYSKEYGVSKSIYFMVEKVKNEVVLKVKDEGIGIPDYDIGKVTQAFYTGDNGRKSYSSSGIGLYFCNEVCRMLGHSMEISSVLAKGTTVKLSYLAKM